MMALADRCTAEGLVARVFGYPASSPPNRDALVAGIVTVIAGMVGAGVPGVGPLPGLVATLFSAGVGFGWVRPWPRRAAWAVVVGTPGPEVKRVSALALDERRLRPWLSPVVGASAALLVVFPGEPWAVGPAALVALLACYDPVRARDLGLEQALAWVRARAGDPETILVVGTAVSGGGEGVAAVVDWYGYDGRAVAVSIDEARPSGASRRLDAMGIGTVS
ncbi:MAG: hypothetical protein FJ090_11635 [Deltaproteobacteria bacterium]|nr:hypothetical protein [Deltaproteobacteria bacterium]